MKIFAEQKEKRSMTETEFVRFLLPSLLSILLCIVCLISLTWAWFSEEVTVNNTIRAGSFEAVVTLGEETLTEGETKTLAVTAAGQSYKLTVTPTGNTSGYCIIKVGDAVYQLSVSAVSTVNITVADGSVGISVTTGWDSATVSDATQIASGDTLSLKGVATTTETGGNGGDNGAETGAGATGN